MAVSIWSAGASNGTEITVAANRSIRVLIVEDDVYVILGLRAFLSGQSGVSIVGEARTGAGGLELAEAAAPDVVVLSMRLPDMPGLEAARKMHVAAPLAKVLVLFDDGEQAPRATLEAAGVSGCLSKGVDPHDFLQALDLISEGGTFFPPS